jgi:serine/threonine protein kinase
VEKLASHVVREGRLSRHDAIGWVVRLCITLEVLHGAGSRHGRISAKAIQVLGTACSAAGFFLDTGELSEDVAYQSPERVKGRGPSADDDVWAAGVLLYLLLTGSLPFSDVDQEGTKRRVLFGAAPTLASHGIHDEGLQALLDALHERGHHARLRDIRELRQRLLACDPTAAHLAALKLGKPNLTIFQDEESDDDGAKLTNLISRDVMDRYIGASRAKSLEATEPMEADDDEPPARPSHAGVDVAALDWEAEDSESATEQQQAVPSAVAPAAPSSAGRARVGVTEVVVALLLIGLGGGAAYYVYGPPRLPWSSAPPATSATPGHER